MALGPARDAQHLRILEDGDVVIHGLLGLVVEPQEGGDLLHVVLLGCFLVTLERLTPRMVPSLAVCPRTACMHPIRQWQSNFVQNLAQCKMVVMPDHGRY